MKSNKATAPSVTEEGVAFLRAISTECWTLFALTLYYYASDWLKNSRHFLDQVQVKPNPIDLMYNDVKQCSRRSNAHCGSCSHERIQYSSNADDVAGPSSSGSGDLFQHSDRSNETIILLFPPILALRAAILDLKVTTTPILPSGRVTSSCIRPIVICWRTFSCASLGNCFEFWLDYNGLFCIRNWPEWRLWSWFYDTRLKISIVLVPPKKCWDTFSKPLGHMNALNSTKPIG